MRNNKKGFALIELLAVLSFGLLFFYTAITIPTELMLNYKELEQNIVNQNNVLNTINTINIDLAKGSNNILDINDNELSINNSIYDFKSDGTIRINGSTIKLNNIPVSYDIDENILHLQSEDNLLDYKANLKYSSFDIEEALAYE